MKGLKVLLWTLLFALIFGAGWFRGYRPDFNLRAYLPSKDPFVILVADRDWLPESFIQKLSEDLDIEIEIEVAEEFADFEARLIPQDAPGLMWMPLSWAQVLAKQKLISDLGAEKKLLAEKVSPDFLLEERGSFVPVLWKMQKDQLRVEGLALPHGGRERSTAIRVLRHWLHNDLAEAQVRELDAGSTLKSLDEVDLPYKQRAKSLRDHDLKVLKK